MIRSVAAVVGMVALAGAANAALLGLHIVEVTGSQPAAANLPADVRSFRIFAEFSGAGSADGAGRVNTVISVGNSNPSGGEPLFWGINLSTNPGANFFQATAGQGGTNVGGLSVSAAARTQWDTFVSIGVPTVDPDEEVGGLPVADTSSADPDFAYVNSDGVAGAAAVGLNLGHDRIRGGWFNASPPNLQGAATNQGGQFLTFLGQVSIGGLAPGAQLGSRASLGVFTSGIFSGEMTIATQAAGQGTDLTRVVFEIPTPGAMALFGLAGVAGLRRRR